MVPNWLMTALMLFMEAWSARRDAQIKLLLLHRSTSGQNNVMDRRTQQPIERMDDEERHAYGQARRAASAAVAVVA